MPSIVNSQYFRSRSSELMATLRSLIVNGKRNPRHKTSRKRSRAVSGVLKRESRRWMRGDFLDADNLAQCWVVGLGLPVRILVGVVLVSSYLRHTSDVRMPSFPNSISSFVPESC